MIRVLLIFSLIWALQTGSSGYAQSVIESKFEQQMIEYESDLFRCYNEMQKFLVENNEILAEMIAFENLLSIYVDLILEIYSTMERVTGAPLETYRAVAARALIFRSLTYLERSKKFPENKQKAINDYQHALQLYESTTIPILNKKLPYEVWIGRKMYTRLADLLDDKNKDFELLKSIGDLNN